ncbi:hypothetical protein DFJ68_3335 [Terracoccus luteus]|uniref:Uncharacterized protein n=1 Tax=Terracoccus luteus TaxID=53356 RepID=A0A495XZY2_9MICO|nr:hypothetical protein [Terracoccus luteus]RKT79857.1 hypothetical protein DFJ68_3335 [Terracoccus luteus]
MTTVGVVVLRRLTRPERGDPFRAQQLTVVAVGVTTGVLGALAAAGRWQLAGLVLVVCLVVLVVAARSLASLVRRLRAVRARERLVFEAFGRPRAELRFHRRQRLAADVPTLALVAVVALALWATLGRPDGWTGGALCVSSAAVGVSVAEAAWVATVHGHRSGWRDDDGRD